MDTLWVLMFFVVWAGMWYWVVKNRGSWPLWFGHIAGIAAGFIVAFVIYMIVRGLTSGEPTAPASAPTANSVKPPEPKSTDTANNGELLGFVAHAPASHSSGPDSPLLPSDSERYPRLSTPLLASTLESGWKGEYAKLRSGADMAKGNNGPLANLICRSVAKTTLRFPESAIFDDLEYYRYDSFKAQTYSVVNRISGQNMQGTQVNLGFDCAVQFVSGNGLNNDQWRLLELNMRGQQSLRPPSGSALDDDLPVYVAKKHDDPTPSADSGLLNNYRDAILSSRSETAFVEKMDTQQRAAHVQLRKNIAGVPDANKRLLAFLMCQPFVHSAMQIPESALFADSKSLTSQRYKDQIYTSANFMKVKNSTGNYVGYRFECTLQASPDKTDGNDDWKLLDLRFEQNGN
jgi:hypothetical protein